MLDRFGKVCPLLALQRPEKTLCDHVSQSSHQPYETSLTDDIVTVLIADQDVEYALATLGQSGQLLNDLHAFLQGAEFDTFLHDVTGKLVLRKGDEIAYDQTDDFPSILWPAMLYHVLSHIITILIADQAPSGCMQFLQHT